MKQLLITFPSHILAHLTKISIVLQFFGFQTQILLKLTPLWVWTQ